MFEQEGLQSLYHPHFKQQQMDTHIAGRRPLGSTSLLPPAVFCEERSIKTFNRTRDETETETMLL